MNTAVISINFKTKVHDVKFFSGEKCWQKADEYLQKLQASSKGWDYLLYRDAEANKEWSDYILGKAGVQEQEHRKRGKDDTSHEKAE